MSSSITSFFNGISQSVTNSQVLDKMMNSGPGEIPYVTFGMVGVTLSALLYVTLTDTAESIGESISTTFENIGAFKPALDSEKGAEAKSEKEEEKEEEEKEEEEKEKEEEEVESEKEEQESESEKEKAKEPDSDSEKEEEEEEEPGEEYKMGGKKKRRKNKSKKKRRRSSKKRSSKRMRRRKN